MCDGDLGKAASTWSLWRPAGKAEISLWNSPSQGARAGSQTAPASIRAVCAFIPDTSMSYSITNSDAPHSLRLLLPRHDEIDKPTQPQAKVRPVLGHRG